MACTKSVFQKIFTKTIALTKVQTKLNKLKEELSSILTQQLNWSHIQIKYNLITREIITTTTKNKKLVARTNDFTTTTNLIKKTKNCLFRGLFPPLMDDKVWYN